MDILIDRLIISLPIEKIRYYIFKGVFVLRLVYSPFIDWSKIMYDVYREILNINQLDLQNQFDVSELLTRVSELPLEENSTVVHAVSIPTICHLCPLHGNKPNCNHCNRFLHP